MVRCPSRTSSRDVNESSMNSGILFFSHPGVPFLIFLVLFSRARRSRDENARFNDTRQRAEILVTFKHKSRERLGLG